MKIRLKLQYRKLDFSLHVEHLIKTVLCLRLYQ